VTRGEERVTVEEVGGGMDFNELLTLIAVLMLVLGALHLIP